MVEFLNITVLLYFVTLTAGYIALFISAVVGVIHVRRELEGSSPESVSARGRATLPITILCPAHNEESTVVESVRALLALRYPQHEVVVCNDGSKDKTLQVLRYPNDVVKAFRLKTPEVVRAAVEKDPFAKTVHDSYYGYLRQQLRWAELSDRAYWQARYI